MVCGGALVSSCAAIASYWPCRCAIGLNWTLTFRQASGGVDCQGTLTVRVLECEGECCSLALCPRRPWSRLDSLVELACLPLPQVLCAIVFGRSVLFFDLVSLIVVVCVGIVA